MKIIIITVQRVTTLFPNALHTFIIYWHKLTITVSSFTQLSHDNLSVTHWSWKLQVIQITRHFTWGPKFLIGYNISQAKSAPCAVGLDFLLDFCRPATKLRQGNVFTRVCDSVHRGRGYRDPTGQRPPLDRDPRTETPLDTDPPRQRSPGQKPPDRDPRTETLLDRESPWIKTPRTVTSGQYTSYWNAF